MGSIISKIEELIDEYGSIDNYNAVKNENNKFINSDIMSKENIRLILDYARDWKEDWEHFMNNPEILPKPLSADDFSEKLSEMFLVEKIK